MARGPSAIAAPTEFCGCMFTMEMKVFCNSTQEQANMQQPAATDLMSRDEKHCTERNVANSNSVAVTLQNCPPEHQVIQ
jgi:hypothetical protein